MGNEKMDCHAGECSCECGRGGGCGCIADSENPSDCDCHCYHSPSAISRFTRIKEGKIPFKPFTSQTKFNICTHDLPISELARMLEKYFPNKIVVPPNRTTDKLTLSLKNKTLEQIINGSGLALKSQL